MKTTLKKLLPELISLRREFHRYPELGFQEFRTQQTIMEYLRSIGIETRKIAGTGVAGILKGKKAGKTLLLRSDMDALPVQEDTGLPFRSENKGIMHACGHDGHMAMLLTAAKLLSKNYKALHGTVVFAFQPNEEDAGAWKMVAEGILENPKVDAAFGCHLWNRFDTGTIEICDGPVMAASHYFTLTVKGCGGHAGFAHESIDPIFVSSHIIQAAQAIQTRQTNALNPAVIMFTSINGGSNTTIIPETVVLKGSIRFLYKGGEELLEKFEQTVKDICRVHNAGYELEFKVGNHLLSNDPSMAGQARKIAARILEDEKKVTGDFRTMAGEDFSEFARKVPAAFAFVGAKPVSGKTDYPHHHPRFDIDENALIYGTRLYAELALDFLKGDLTT